MSLVNAIINQDQYVLAPSLQMFFINPLNSQPLAAGTITFYRDVDRTPTGYKPVYRIGGTPTAPTFTPLPNPITLDQNGIFIDPNNGDEILPYYDIVDSDGNVDLYYIVVQDQFGATIETLEHFPQVNQNGENIFSQLPNFIPNGQFLSHLNLPNSGLISSMTTSIPIAYGGWVFTQNSGSSSMNYVTFTRYNSPLDNPINNPRYAVMVNCTFANPSDSAKQIENIITNVNFIQGQNATLSFTAYSNDGNNHNVDVIIYQNFGTGGSSPVSNIIDTVLITPQIQSFTINFTMPSTTGKTLGALDDDYLKIIIQTPLDSISNISFTDIIGVQETVTTLFYPPESPEQDKAFTYPASFDIPAYDGSDIGKFVQLNYTNDNQSRLGFVYTNKSPYLIQTGMHFAWIGTTAPDGFLMEDGSSYAVQPGGNITSYPDLFNLMLNSMQSVDAVGHPLGTYAFGTGLNGFQNYTVYSPYPSLPTNALYVVWNRYDVVQAIPSVGNCPFNYFLMQPANPNMAQQVYSFVVTGASLLMPGSYYLQYVNTTGPQFTQMFWFTIDGVGSIPSVAFDVAVRIDLLSTDTAENVRDKIIKYANGLFQVPDLRNYFIRYWNNGSYHTGLNNNPNNRTYAQNYRSLLSSYPAFFSGNSGDTIGSLSQEVSLNLVSLSFNNVAGDVFFNAIIKY